MSNQPPNSQQPNLPPPVYGGAPVHGNPPLPNLPPPVHSGAGEQRLRTAIRSTYARSTHTRKNNPRPYDDDWGWWIEQRLERLENAIKWLTGLATATLAAEIIRIALAALGLTP